MKLTRLVTLRSLSTRRLRSLLTFFGIMLGVAAIFAINFTNQNAYHSITALFEGTAGRVNLEVRSAANIGGYSEEILNAVQDTPGISMAVPVLKLPAALPGERTEEIDLNFFGTDAGGFIIHGIHPLNDLDIRDYRITQGRFMQLSSGDMEVVLVEDYALEHDLETGQTISILTSHGQAELKLVGLIAKESAGLTNLGKFGVMELGAAQELSRREGQVDQIDVVVDEQDSNPAYLSEVREILAARLGNEYTVVSPANQGDRMTQMLSGYQIGLNFMAGIALFVGAFLIYNAFSMTVTERTRELGLLRSVGMTSRQVTIQVIFEGLILGISGALAGAGAGILLSYGLTGLMAGMLGQTLSTGSIPVGILFASMSIGVVVTLIAAFMPARQAGRISPLEALRLRSHIDEGWLIRYGWIAGVLLLIFSTTILYWNPFPYDVQFRLGSLTVFALFLGAMLVIPVTLRAWQYISKLPVRIVFGSLGAVGVRNLDRARKRTMLTCTALLIGVSMIVVTQGMTGSFTADLYAWMDAYTGGDIFVSAAVPVTRDLQDDLEELSSVDTAAPIRYIDVIWLNDGQEETISLMGVDLESYTNVTSFIFSDQDVSADQAITDFNQGGALFVSSVLSEKYNIQPGDQLEIKTRQNEQMFRVAAIVLDFYNQGMVVTGSLSDLSSSFETNDVNTFLIKTSNGSGTAIAIDEISSHFKDDYQLIIESNSSIRERADKLMKQAFVMFDVLGVIAVLVAALGVLNTLSISVIERTREIGMLRAMGMTRFQTIKMILAEAGLLGVIGAILGIGFGLALTRIFLAAMGAMSGYILDFVMPVRAIWLGLIVALIISQIAALFPAIRAAKTPVLTSIHYE